MNIRDIIELDGTEVGEMLSLLNRLRHGYVSYMSNELNRAIRKELAENLLWFRANMQIKEITHTNTIKYKELVEKW